MAQYRIISSINPLTLYDSTDKFRYAIRVGALFLDQEIGGAGFDGDEDEDWGNIEENPSSGGDTFRLGVRDGKWVLDASITVDGFDGTIDEDWENLEEHEFG